MTNRAERRRLDRALDKLLRRDGDHCTLCQARFTHNQQTYYGTSGGKAAVVGDCCGPQLESVLAVGLYTIGHYDVPAAKGKEQCLTLAQAFENSCRLQDYIAATDQDAADMAKRAGLPKPLPIRYSDSAGKADDRKWFADHPDRSHRLRPRYPSDPVITEPVPDGHEFQTLVRQVEPGKRVLIAFCHNIEAPIPDSRPCTRCSTSASPTAQRAK